MSGQNRVMWCAAAATLCAAATLVPLAESAGWLVQAVALLVAVAGAGALTRRAPLPRPVTPVVQALLGVHLLAALFAHAQTLWGFLAGPAVFQELGRLLQHGLEDVGRYTTPAPVTPGIRLLLVGGVVLVGLMVDAMAVTYRAAAAAGLPLLALYSVGTGLTWGDLGWLWFLLAAVGYLLLLVAEGRDRLARWGRVFGGAPGDRVLGPRGSGPVRGGLVRGGAGRAPGRTGPWIGAATLSLALLVPAALPALDGGLLTGGAVGSGGGGATISAVNPLVSLQDSLNQSEDREVLRYSTSASDPGGAYLRIVALDQFDGATWRPSSRPVTDVPAPLPAPPGLDPDVQAGEVRTTVTAADWYAQNWLPMPYPASQVDIAGRWRFEPVGRTIVGDRGQTTRGAQYTVVSLAVRPSAARLAAAPAPPAELRKEYTRLPGGLPATVRATALRVTRGAGTDYARAVALQDWFAYEGGFTYDTHVRTGTGVDAIARFLRDKRGFCVHFAFSMATMARSLGIPARVAVGFTPGTPQSDGSMSVGVNDAHAWPELYFQGAGWMRFEPTPSRGSPPDYTVPDAPAAGGGQEPSTAPKASGAPAAPARPSPACTAGGASCGTSAPEAAAPSRAGGDRGAGVLLWPLAALVAALTACLPLLVRGLVRRHRRRAAATPGEGAVVLWRELVDTAWDLGIPPQRSLTPRRTAERIVAEARLPAPAAEAVRRVSRAAERALYAADPSTAPLSLADLAEARAALEASVSGGRRLRAIFLPASHRRLWWAAVERLRAARRGMPALRRDRDGAST
ncbi:DUF3488 and DUF4129 domain-containing transglutaminase family protein [Streptomyces sp. NPDC059740]|uniref:transglutaminase TgpA family protein n=1 Tax=Streptomyces sp. NPDC059740 TaxID=3346926 RepID=UPI00366821E5